VDVTYIPQAVLSAEWEGLTGAPVVDVRRIEERGEKGRESALAETVGYVAKAPEFLTVEDEVEYLKALKGSPLIGTTGPLGNPRNPDETVPPVGGILKCAECGVAPSGWKYLGYVDGCMNTMTLETQGDRPPPGNEGS
jgi:hypothetical protein